ncbi:MAG TPA: PilZ domain-containing protein [Terriglobales bacterium]|nr:PilZ domain-containing protein [Terriglobales bacterium]
MHEPERRKSRRFPLRQPAYVRPLEGEGEQLAAMTQNVSKDGVLLLAEKMLPVGMKGELVLVLESRLERSIRLSGTGEVRRVDELTPQGKYAIAFSCEQAFSLLD